MVAAGKMAPHIKGDFAVFLIGIAVNSWWNLPQAWFSFPAFPAMIKELKVRP